MKRLIYQVQISNSAINYVGNKSFRYVQNLYKLSANQAKKYAQECNSDYHVITDTSFLPTKHPIYQKLKVFTFTDYDQILYVDSDAVICNNIPNIFDLYQEHEFSAPWDWNWDSSSVYYKKYKQRVNKIYNASENYNPFNSGVMLINKSFLIKNKDNWLKYIDSFDKKGFQDQGIFNKLIVDNNEVYNNLPLDWGSCARKGKYIIHLYGHKKNNFDIEKFCKKNNFMFPKNL